jgi:hypothetical protein
MPLILIPMVSHFRPIGSSGLRRAAYLACGLIVLSYFLFDVLDLDGSNFLLLLTPLERSVIVAELPSEIELTHSLERSEPLGDIAFPLAEKSGNYIRLQRAKRPGSSLLDSARCHGYRVGLARDSVPDSPPYG